MTSGKPLFQTIVGLGVFRVFPDEVHYDSPFGKSSDKHWVIARDAVQDVTCQRVQSWYSLTFYTKSGTRATPVFWLGSDALQAISTIMPTKLQTDPVLLQLQQRKQQNAYKRELAAYRSSLKSEQLVRTYRHNPEKNFRNDARRLARRGWVVQSQSAGGMKRASLAEWFWIGNAVQRRVGEMTVVYTRQRKPLPMPTPPQQQSTPAAPTQASAISSASVTAQSQPVPAVAPAQVELLGQLEKLGELHHKGILTDDEFAAKKADILSRM